MRGFNGALWRFVAGAVVVLSSGCGKRGFETPEEAASVLVETGARGDAEGFRGLFPSREEIGEWLSCGEGIDLGARFDGPHEELVTWRTAAPKVLGLSRADVEKVPSGGGVGGCVARRDLELVRIDVTIQEGRAERVLPMRFIGVENRYKVLGY